ncbi:hypothetical protein [Campylobacter porcelli]|uniref:Septum formation initiator n=1 Tax=Campylobacter porcelli TaxID=1660073 RepID=A0A1X9SW10_9BACT|nr:hypothetical protein [Campylobacter sp. RM6137]ARR00432.1 hypothetical protein CSUIS_0615 [Campylobacter sp. RM6137]MEE3703972.1 hypothetical protein [Campylobacter sp. CX2-8023-23]MEE3744856.1 hypothetical protein [Campylobacter sp. CX2-4855-23]MEE3775875.1 hypothetical protein [Campylobacter sp. CX2-4080-23]
MRDKENLLQKNIQRTKKENNLNFKTLIIAYAALLIILALALPKVYFSNEIYYTSKSIAELKSKLNVLKEENKLLKRDLEYIRYKNQIIDNMSD